MDEEQKKRLEIRRKVLLEHVDLDTAKEDWEAYMGLEKEERRKKFKENKYKRGGNHVKKYP